MRSLRDVEPTAEARTWAERCGGSPEFRELVLRETRRMHGKILEGCPAAMLTELKPDGMREGTILVANAGLDESNATEGHVIGWPEDPVASARKLSDTLHVPVIISDSTCRPRRLGVTAIALTVVGIDPIRSLIGTRDLHGRTLRMTHEAVADQLATAANILMGNADQSIPAVAIRHHNIPRTKFAGWVPGIDAKEDIFRM